MKLAAFDFDHTIIDVNSDTFIDRLITNENDMGSISKRFKYPDEIENLTQTHNWTHRMNAVFEFMNKNYSIKKTDLISCLHHVKIDQSMIDLINLLSEKEYELVILSDANSVFIEEILKNNGLIHLFKKIYTNEAKFDIETECLKVQPFNEQFNLHGELFSCPTNICSTNICKGTILTHHLNNYKQLNLNQNKHLIYVGDGHNDYCPGLYLDKNDFYFVRNNHSLSRLLKQKEGLANKIKSNVFYWTTAKDIIDKI